MEFCLDMEGELVVSGKDLRKWRLVDDLLKKNKSQSEVGEELELSVRQVRRLARNVKLHCKSAVFHFRRKLEIDLPYSVAI